MPCQRYVEESQTPPQEPWLAAKRSAGVASKGEYIQVYVRFHCNTSAKCLQRTVSTRYPLWLNEDTRGDVTLSRSKTMATISVAPQKGIYMSSKIFLKKDSDSCHIESGETLLRALLPTLYSQSIFAMSFFILRYTGRQ